MVSKTSLVSAERAVLSHECDKVTPVLARSESVMIRTAPSFLKR